MANKKAKEWDSWKDVRETYGVERPHQVKMRVLWYWIKEIALSMGASPRLIKSHEHNWKVVEQKENEAAKLMDKLRIKGSESE